MVTEGIVLGHKISTAILEVDQAKVVVIKTLRPPTTTKGIRSFLGHTGFYRRFIKNFSKISRPLCRLLEKDAKFDFNESCRFVFDEIKSRLETVLQKVLQRCQDKNLALNWKKCHFMVTEGIVLGHKISAARLE